MNITDFVKNMNKTFKKYDVKFVANYADVYDSVVVFIKCKEPKIVAEYLYNEHFRGVKGTNIGVIDDKAFITFFDFSEYSSSEIEQLIVDAIFGAKARFNLFGGKMMNKKSIKEGIDIKVIYCDDTPSEYIDDVTMNDIYDILDSSSDICKIVDVSGSKKKVVWTDYYGFERAYESKKSVKKSMKESENFEDYLDDLPTYSKKDIPSSSKPYYFWTYYEYNISDNEWVSISMSGKDYNSSLKQANKFAKADDVEKAYLVFKDPNGESFKVIIKKDLIESKKFDKKSFTEGLRYNPLTLELIQDDIELYFEDKGYDVKIIDIGMAKALNVSYIYICKGKDFNKIKSDDLHDFLYSDVINGLLYYNDDFNVVVKNKQIMIILPKTSDYTE